MPASAAKQLDHKQRAAEQLLDHYRSNARVLPWRSPPGTAPPDPYRVWLSEVMLQQTTVKAVTPRFERFITRWPTIEALAAASDEEILGEWAGLGYYARARNLIACARDVAKRGGFPDTADGLRELPGIGTYTAAAVAAIAFGRDSCAIDTNIERIVARLNALKDKAAIRAAAEAMVPAGRAGDFAQGMMDLGSAICRPKAPECRSCPLQDECASFALGRPEDFPERKTRQARPHRHGLAYWHERDDAIFLVRRPEKGLLGGMAALPGSEWRHGQAPDDAIATIRHGFTHFTLDLHIVESGAAPPNRGWWQPLAGIDEAGLPSLYKTAVERVLSGRAGKSPVQSPRNA
ncbi:A/G-specific adenine glycosylase [Sphingomonas sp. HDW15A]|uniref:A/G-specific adenine glycosylase n=1 Tax=Sphingomonas sp. HDW15A TaxID=2714942 RepID=UPI00140A8236|nr:A/G-specific adenine glycosylase [Sphingomonas sp. HDW15A]QIK96695.1 A/G-specific adenine glycosylase [Sphingomonas sp. HDW15A]